MYAALTLTIFLAQQSAISRLFHRLSDKTFSGIYHPNAFDLAMMIPYFIVLLVLAMYGLHRYWLVYEYFQYSKNVPPLPPPVTNWPRITVQLPIFNERYVIERLTEAVARFDYPRELLDVIESMPAKLESCWSKLLLEHAGQLGASDPRTTASNRRSHSLQIYSKIGIRQVGYRG